MATKPLIGGYDYNATLAELQAAAKSQRLHLQALMEPGVGENQRTAYQAKIIYDLTTIFKCITELQRFAQIEKLERESD